MTGPPPTRSAYSCARVAPAGLPVPPPPRQGTEGASSSPRPAPALAQRQPRGLHFASAHRSTSIYCWVEQVYDGGVTVYERDATRARTAYIAALYRLGRAMDAFDHARVPLTPGPGGRIEDWTPEQMAVMRTCARAWSDVVRARRQYDDALRTLNPGTWPH